MIRLAFIGVLFFGGLIAFGGFHLVRGSDETLIVVPQQEPHSTPHPSSAAAEVKNLYFLQNIDLNQSDIALVLFNLGPDPLFVRDIDVIKAAQNSAYVSINAPDGQLLGKFSSPAVTTSTEDIVAQIYRNDELLGTISCDSSACGDYSDSIYVQYGGLLTAATPIQRIEDHFDIYSNYLSTIYAVAADPEFMLLHARPPTDFPELRTAASMQVGFPRVIAPTSDPLDEIAHELLVSFALSAVLPDGASLRDVTITNLGNGIVGDSDSRTPVLARGSQISYPDVLYYSVTAWIDGAASFDQSILDLLTNQTLDQYDFTTDFAVFARDQLQSSCVDCFWILMEGGSRNNTHMIQSQAELYNLEYFDLRDTP